jgi:hypothetical protein
MGIILLVVIVAVAAMASAVVFYVFPSTMASLLRYKLWPLRDELSDAIANGEFEDSTQPTKLLHSIEIAIQAADDLRPLNMVVLLLLARPNLADRDGFDASKVAEPDKVQVLAIYNKYMRASLRHILTGSWSGLLLALFLVPVVAVVSILNGRSKGGDGPFAEAAKQVSIEPTLQILATQTTYHHLSASI